MTASLPPLPDLDALMEISARISAASRAVPALAGAQAEDLIRHVPGKRAVLRGSLDGRSAIFRVNLASETASTARQWAEMQRLWPYMSSGALRIPEPLGASAAHGLIVQEHADGTPLLEFFYRSEPGARAPWLPRAAAWLRRATAMSEDWQPARPEGWIARARRAADRQPFAQLRMLERGILEQMQRLAPQIAAAPWRMAICHGDYHPNNLLAGGTRLTGIDLGFSQRMPLLKDIARFAMHLGRRRVRLSGQTTLGVDRACLAAFTDAFDLTTVERGATLPFFLGFEALIRVESAGLPAGRITRAEKTYHALLCDLRRTDGNNPLLPGPSAA